MNTEEILKLANAAAPELMERAVGALAELEREAPEIAQSTLQEFRSITARAVDGVEKNAGMLDAAGKAIKGLATHETTKRIAGGVIGATTAALGVAIATDLWDAAKRGITHGSSYKRMIEANPDLRKEDQKKVSDAFNSVHRLAPEIAADPIFAGSIVNNLVQLPTGAFKTLSDAIKTRTELANAKQNKFPLQTKNFVDFMAERPKINQYVSTDLMKIPEFQYLMQSVKDVQDRLNKRKRP